MVKIRFALLCVVITNEENNKKKGNAHNNFESLENLYYLYTVFIVELSVYKKRGEQWKGNWFN